MTFPIQRADDSPLRPAEVLAGARLVVLGGTGFLGKVFWSMLLHRFPDIGRIYLLVRSSADESSEARFWARIATSPALEPLRAQHGESFEHFLRDKIVPIDGDTGRAMCGVGGALVDELRGTIDAVVNLAGVVDFNPPLDEALDANAFGSQNLVALARALGDVPLFHTSTCYVAGLRKGPIYERDAAELPFPRAADLGAELWDPDREIAECLELVAQAKHRASDAFRQSEFKEKAENNLLRRGEPVTGAALESELAHVKRKFVEAKLVEAGLDRATHWGWPNVYTYTKSIGEQVITRSGLAHVIVRPACCESCVAYPMPGWNEGIGTSAPTIFLGMKGHLQMPLGDVPLDFVPTDMVVAGMILALSELLEGRSRQIYQLAASDINPCMASRFGELVGLYKRKHYQRKAKGNPFLNFLQAHVEVVGVTPERFRSLSSPAVAKFGKELARLLERMPAGPAAPLAREAAATLGRVATQEQKIAHLVELFVPFMTQGANGPFDCTNTRAAYARLSEDDKARLAWVPETIDWAWFMHEVHLPAMEKWVFPEMEKRIRKELTPLRAHPTLVSLLDEMATRHDLGVALSRLEADGFTRLTFREVRERADAVAARLAARGVGRGDRVLLAAKNHPDWPIAYFGIVRAGAAVVPVDPGLEPAGIANILRESGAKVALWDRFVEDQAGDDVRARHPEVAVIALAEATAPDPTLVRPAVEVAGGDVASVIFTSGTTGKPKGVLLTHANFTSLIAALAPIFPLGSRDRVLSVLPLHHTFEFTCGLLLPFSRGARIHYLDRLEADRMAEALKLGRITGMVGVPALWQLFERRIWAKVDARGPVAAKGFEWATELNSLMGRKLGIDAGRLLFGPVHAELGGHVKYLISGGAALPHDTQKLFKGLGLPLTEGYGLTEAAPVLTVSKPSPKAALGQVGKPVPGVEIRIADPDDRGVGEILARGPNVMAGYTDADETARVIVDGWLRTGDLGRFDSQGRLVIVGRAKDVIVNSTGENVYPDDVEHALGKLEHVKELAIVGVDAPAGGERVACLAVPEPDESVPRAVRTERTMRALRVAFDALPFHQRPAVVHLTDADLPRTATRKVKRGDVRRTLERMIVAQDAPLGGPGEATAVRTAVASVCGRPLAEVVGSAELAGHLGFDSLMMQELLSVLEVKHGAIDPAALAACRSVSDVELLVGEARARPRISVIEGRDDDGGLVLPAQVQDAGKRVIGKLQDFFYGGMMKPRVTGRAFIPHNRNVIVVANHSSHLDMGFVRHALGKYGEDIVSLAAQDYFFETGWKKTFFENFSNLEPIDRKSGLRAGMRQAADVLARGKTVLIFPEGTRSSDGSIHEFKPLVAQLALAHGLDILPVFLGGTHEAMPKGRFVPTRRELVARIGPPFAIADMRRLTEGLSASDAAREIARLTRAAVLALRDGKVLDLSRLKKAEAGAAVAEKHPLVGLFAELENKFRADRVEKPLSYYFTLGQDALAKWTVRVDPMRCDIRVGRPENGVADCVLKTSPEMFTRIVREAYTPSPAEFLSGAVKSNDLSLLVTFQRVFALDG